MVRRRFVGVVLILTLFGVGLMGCGKDPVSPKAEGTESKLEQKAPGGDGKKGGGPVAQ